MGKIVRFEDLLVWQEARTLSKEIYVITNEEPFKKDIRFVQQIRAASGSIMDNIAEGFERDGNKEFLNFLYYSKGSCGEVKSQLYRAMDAGFISEQTFKTLTESCNKISASIAKLIMTLKSSEITGIKNK